MAGKATEPARRRIKIDKEVAGRPRIFEDNAKVGRLLEALEMGMPRDDAVLYAGIGRSSFYDHMAVGKKLLEEDENSEAEEATFTRKVLLAEATFKYRGLKLIDVIAKNNKDPDLQLKAITWALERRDPKNFGRRVDVTSGDEPIETGVAVLLPANGRETPT